MQFTISAFTVSIINFIMLTSPVASAGNISYTTIWGNCVSYSVHGGTSVAFNGELTTVETGDVGVAPGTDLTGNYATTAGASHLNDASAINCFNDKIGILNALKGATCNVSLPVPELGGTTQTPGIMCYEAMSLTGTVTLDGMNDPNAVFVFQTAKALVVETSGTVNLINGAKAKNVYWAIGTSASLKTSVDFAGSIVAGASITFDTNARILGRALAGAAVTFAGLDVVALPADSYAFVTNNTRVVASSTTRRQVASTTTVSAGQIGTVAQIGTMTAASLTTGVRSATTAMPVSTTVSGTVAATSVPRRNSASSLSSSSVVVVLAMILLSLN